MARNHPPVRPRVGVWLGLALALSALTLVVSYALRAREGFFTENGPVEIAQMIFLAPAVLAFALAALGARGHDRRLDILLTSLAALALVREIPRCTSPYYDGGLCIAGDWKDGAYLLAAIPAILLGLLRLLPAWRPRREEISRSIPDSLWMWPLALAPIMIATALFFENAGVPRVEEGMETAAYAYILLFSLWAALHAPRLVGGGKLSRRAGLKGMRDAR